MLNFAKSIVYKQIPYGCEKKNPKRLFSCFSIKVERRFNCKSHADGATWLMLTNLGVVNNKQVIGKRPYFSLNFYKG